MVPLPARKVTGRRRGSCLASGRDPRVVHPNAGRLAAGGHEEDLHAVAPLLRATSPRDLWVSSNTGTATLRRAANPIAGQGCVDSDAQQSDKDGKTNRCDRLRRCSRHWLPLDSQGERLPSAPSSSSVFGVRSPRAASGILEATPSVELDALSVFGAWGRAPLSTPVPTREQQEMKLHFLITELDLQPRAESIHRSWNQRWGLGEAEPMPDSVSSASPRSPDWDYPGRLPPRGETRSRSHPSATHPPGHHASVHQLAVCWRGLPSGTPRTTSTIRSASRECPARLPEPQQDKRRGGTSGPRPASRDSRHAPRRPRRGPYGRRGT